MIRAAVSMSDEKPSLTILEIAYANGSTSRKDLPPSGLGKERRDLHVNVARPSARKAYDWLHIGASDTIIREDAVAKIVGEAEDSGGGSRKRTEARPVVAVATAATDRLFGLTASEPRTDSSADRPSDAEVEGTNTRHRVHSGDDSEETETDEPAQENGGRSERRRHRRLLSSRPLPAPPSTPTAVADRDSSTDIVAAATDSAQPLSLATIPPLSPATIPPPSPATIPPPSPLKNAKRQRRRREPPERDLRR
jgi:hypothetical protein